MLGVFLLAAAIGGVDTVCDATTGFTAEQMFERARDVWSSAQYPRDVYYSVVVHAEEDDKVRSVRYDGHTDTIARVIAIHRFSEEETRDPYVPHGINVAVRITIGILPAYTKVLTKPEPTFDELGIPRLSPLYSFGIRRKNAPAASPATPAPTASNATILKSIGGTATRTRDYDVTCGGLELNPNAPPVMRLSLKPRRDPGRLRLRTIWLDPQSFTVSKIETQGNFTRDAPVTAPWLTTFVMRDGLPYITSERSEAPLRVDGKLLRNVEIEFLPRDPPGDTASRILFDLRHDARELREPDGDV